MSKKMNKFDWQQHVFAQPFNGQALRVLWCYASHADTKTLVTYPAIKEVAKQTGVGQGRVGKIRNALISEGWLVETTEKAGRGHKLRLAVGNNITPGELGEKRRVNPKSIDNLKRGTQKVIKSSEPADDAPEYRDKTCLDNREGTCPEVRGDTCPDNREGDSPEYRDLIVILNNQYSNNQSLSVRNNQPTGPVGKLKLPAGPTSLLTQLENKPQKLFRNSRISFNNLSSLNGTPSLNGNSESLPASPPRVPPHPPSPSTNYPSTKYLDELLNRDSRHTDESKAEARRLFLDKSWRPNDSDARRATAADITTVPMAEPAGRS